MLEICTQFHHHSNPTQVPRHCSPGERIPHYQPRLKPLTGNSKKWADSTRSAPCGEAVLEPKVFFCFPRKSQSFGEFQIGSYSLHQCKGLGQLKQKKESGKDGRLFEHCDRHFQSFSQSATSNFLCNMQGNCSCLRARLLYSQGEKFT